MTSEVVVLAAGLALGVAAAVAVRFVFERSGGRRASPSAPPPGAALAAPARDAAPPAEPAVEPPGRPETTASPPATKEFRATVRQSERVILHIYAQGRWASGETVPPAITQAGIGSAIGSSQSSLAKTLSRLRAAGVVDVELRHVRGGARRFKVYRLTPLGESLARNLREVEARRRAPAAERPSSGVPR